MKDMKLKYFTHALLYNVIYIGKQLRQVNNKKLFILEQKIHSIFLIKMV